MKVIYAIIVTYNGFKWVDKCFGSLFNSSIPVNIITIDNSSKDGTPEYIRKHFPKIDLIENKKNQGFGQANNIGIKKAYDSGADYVFLLNQDAWVEKDTIEKLVEVAEKNPEFGIVSPMHLNGKGDELDLNFSNWIIPKNCPGLFSDLYLKTVKKEVYETTYVNAAAWLISKICIETVGGFNPLFFIYGEDDNYLQRAKYFGFRIGVNPHSKIFHDRKEKEKHNTFIEHTKIFQRRLLFKYCDPSNNFDIKMEESWLRRGAVKFLLKGNFAKYKSQLEDLRIILQLKEKILETKEKSQNPGLTFL